MASESFWVLTLCLIINNRLHVSQFVTSLVLVLYTIWRIDEWRASGQWVVTCWTCCWAFTTQWSHLSKWIRWTWLPVVDVYYTMITVLCLKSCQVFVSKMHSCFIKHWEGTKLMLLPLPRKFDSWWCDRWCDFPALLVVMPLTTTTPAAATTSNISINKSIERVWGTWLITGKPFHYTWRAGGGEGGGGDTWKRRKKQKEKTK